MKLKYAFIVLAVIMVFGCLKKEKQTLTVTDQSEKVKAEMGIWLESGAICKNVENYQAIEPGTEFQTDGTINIYFLTKIGSKKPGFSVYHRYSVLKKGLSDSPGIWQEHFFKELAIKSISYNTWTYITAYPGKWRADLLAPDKESIIKTVYFTVTGPETASELKGDESYDISRIALEDSALSEKVENRQPVNPGSQFALPEGASSAQVWAWVKVKAEQQPTVIFFRWSKKTRSVDAQEDWIPQYTILMDIKGASWTTWAYMNCTEGAWRLDILAPDGRSILKTSEFKVKPGAGA